MTAFAQMYSDMAGRHRARPRSIQIIRTALVKDEDVKRENMLQFATTDVKFPLPHRIQRAPNKKTRPTFLAKRPSTHFN
jgi:large subunit ribosomal protein L18Ae